MPSADWMAWAFSREGIQAAKDFLSSAQQQENTIGLCLARLDTIRERAQRVTRAIDHLPGGSGNGDGLARAVCDTVEMEQQLLAEYHKLLEHQRNIQQLIGEIPDAYQRLVLQMRYLQGLSLLGIARRINYDERTVQRIIQKGLRHAALRLAIWRHEGRMPKGD